MAKIRHIAYRAEDVEGMVEFFTKAFDMELVGRRGNGVVDLSDGSVNITLLPLNRARGDGREPTPGIEHIGFDSVKLRLAERAWHLRLLFFSFPTRMYSG